MSSTTSSSSQNTTDDGRVPSSNAAATRSGDGSFSIIFSTATNMYVASPYIDFPQFMSIHGPKSRRKPFYISTGCSTQHPPLFAISGRPGKGAGYILRDGPNDDGGILAKIDGSKSLIHTITFLTPSEFSDEFFDDMELGTVIMQAHTIGTTGVGFRFTVDVGSSPRDDIQLKTFEWRRFEEGDDEYLDRDGYKLLRMSTHQTQAMIDGRLSRNETAKVDGYEVVAKMIGREGNNEDSEDYRAYCFDLTLCNAASNGRLGNRWAMITILTAKKIWDMDYAGKADWNTIDKLEREAPPKEL